MQIQTHESIDVVTEATFEKRVLRAKTPVLVEFSTTWCPPCRALEPLLRTLASDTVGRLEVVTVDGDDNVALASQFGIRGFPTTILFSEGKEVARQLGLTPMSRLRALVAPHIEAV